MTTTIPSTAIVVPVEPLFAEKERTALAGFLAGYSGLTRDAYTLDLRMFTAWCQQHGLHLFQARRADIECFGRDMETLGRARATIARRLCTIAGFYRYAVEEELLDHSPAVHVRRPRLDYESHAIALDRNEVGSLLVAAGLGAPNEHALISLLAINGLRISEALGADIDALGLERGHRTLTVLRKGGKIVTIPLAPRTARTIDLATGERLDGPIFLRPDGQRMDRHCASRIVRPRRPPRRGAQADRPAHPAARVHHRRPRRRRATSGRSGSRLARRSTHDHALRPGTRFPGPARHLHRRRLPCRSCSISRTTCRAAPAPQSAARLQPAGRSARAVDLRVIFVKPVERRWFVIERVGNCEGCGE
jgi:integrase/recombinase XerD